MKPILELLTELNPTNDYESSDDFIGDGLIDSADLQELFSMIEEEYGIRLAGTDMTPQNFRNLESIEELLADHGIEFDD